jgi:hypothetical protein
MFAYSDMIVTVRGHVESFSQTQLTVRGMTEERYVIDLNRVPASMADKWKVPERRIAARIPASLVQVRIPGRGGIPLLANPHLPQ